MLVNASSQLLSTNYTIGNMGTIKHSTLRRCITYLHNMFSRSTTYKMSSKWQMDGNIFNQSYSVPKYNETIVSIYHKAFYTEKYSRSLANVSLMTALAYGSTTQKTKTSVCSMNLHRTDPSNYAADDPLPTLAHHKIPSFSKPQLSKTSGRSM